MKITNDNWHRLHEAGDSDFKLKLRSATYNRTGTDFYVYPDQLRKLLDERGDPRALPRAPGIAGKAKNLSSSVATAARMKGGFNRVSEGVFRERMDACSSCKFVLKNKKGAPKSCRKCGCQLQVKARRAGFDCPEGKWGEVSEDEPERAGPLAEYFDEVYCITLSRSKGRYPKFLQSLPRNWPLGGITRWEGHDGHAEPPPKGAFTKSRGAWGCLQSHLRIMEDAMEKGHARILILEDDARFDETFAGAFAEAVSQAPEGWGKMYLGGQHLYPRRGKPISINDHWAQPFNVNRTHAYALQGDYIRQMYAYASKSRGHIDHHYGRHHKKRDGRVICPAKWFAWQASGKSLVSGKRVSERKWLGAKPMNRKQIKHPVIVVAGTHSAGTSCVAGMLWHLKAGFMGSELVGRYGNKPGQQCGYEAPWLHRVLFDNIRWGTTINHGSLLEVLELNFREMIEQAEGVPIIVKHPLLCAVDGPMRKLFGDKVKVILVDRPLEDSIGSLSQKVKLPPGTLRSHMQWLARKKEHYTQFDHLRVEYQAVLDDPAKEAQRIAAFLGLEFPEEEIFEAIKAHVQPGKFETSKASEPPREASQQAAIKRAKVSYPEPASYDPEDLAMHFIIKSRRDGLEVEDRHRFEELVSENLGVFLQWSDRWIISLVDTFAENGYPQMRVLSAIRMMDKFYNAVEGNEGFERRVSAKGMDVHTNMMKRLRPLLPPGGAELFLAYVDQQFEHEDSLWSRVQRYSDSDVQAQVRRELS